MSVMLDGRRDEKPVEINGGKRSNSSFITALLLLLSISPLLSSTMGLFTYHNRSLVEGWFP